VQEQYYQEWVADPTPERLSRVVGTLERPISFALARANAQDDSRARHQARLITAKAVSSFRPDAGANLNSWVINQLQGLNRYTRQNAGSVKVPDRARLDGYSLKVAEDAFIARTGQEPTDAELAEEAKMSMDRLRKVRGWTRPTVAEGVVEADAHTQTDFDNEALDYVYNTTNKLNQRILDRVVGYGGRKPISRAEAATEFGVSPSLISRRLAGLAYETQTMRDKLHKVHG